MVIDSRRRKFRPSRSYFLQMAWYLILIIAYLVIPRLDPIATAVSGQLVFSGVLEDEVRTMLLGRIFFLVPVVATWIFIVRRWLQTRVDIDEAGFSYSARGSVERIDWKDVKSIKFIESSTAEIDRVVVMVDKRIKIVFYGLSDMHALKQNFVSAASSFEFPFEIKRSSLSWNQPVRVTIVFVLVWLMMGAVYGFV